MHSDVSSPELFPDRALSRLFARIPRRVYVTVIAALAIGLLVHLYAFTNLLVNHDDLCYLLSFNYGTESGRWFTPLISRIGGDLSMPWLLGTLSLVLLAASACLIGACFQIRRTLPCILLGGLVVAFPSVTSGFLYMFTAASYAFGVLLACLAAYLALRYKWGFLIAIVPLTCALGVYQTYFSFAAGLMVGALLLSFLSGETKAAPVVKKGLLCLLSLAVSMAAYFVIVKLTTAESGMTDYQGLSEIGTLSLADLPAALVHAYTSAAGLFLRDASNTFMPAIRVVWALAFAAGGVLLALCYLRVRRACSVPARIAAFALLLIFPLASNLICVMAPELTLDGGVHDLMRYPLVLMPVLLIAFYERCADLAAAKPESPNKARRVWAALPSWVLSAALIVCLWGCHVSANTAYGWQTLALHQAESYYTRAASFIEQTEGYDPALPVLFAGQPHELTRSYAEQEQHMYLIGVFNADMLIQSYSYRSLMSNFVGFTPEWLDETDPARAEALLSSEAVAAMPVYPAVGSAAVLDGVLVVNFGE